MTRRGRVADLTADQREALNGLLLKNRMRESMPDSTDAEYLMACHDLLESGAILIRVDDGAVTIKIDKPFAVAQRLN